MAMADTPEDSLTLLAQLPAANANSLRLLLQLCHHIDDRSAATEMDAQVGRARGSPIMKQLLGGFGGSAAACRVRASCCSGSCCAAAPPGLKAPPAAAELGRREGAGRLLGGHREGGEQECPDGAVQR